ncbi:MAG: AI-2E family transporter [Firmicutes bacterium]|nr:AI-2E family transporter [Bacillota bacterium]
MKLPFDRDYFKISLYASVCAISVFAAVFVITNIVQIIDGAVRILKSSFELAAPLFIGIFIAFLLEPLTEFFEKSFSKGHSKYRKRYIGAVMSFVTVGLVLIFVGVMLCRNVGTADMSGIALGVNRAAEEMLFRIDNLQYNLSHMGILSYLNGAVNSMMGYISYIADRIVSSAASAVAGAGSAAIDIGIGSVTAFYFLLEKEKIILRLKDVTYTFLPAKAADVITSFFKDITVVFSGYIAGQMIDAMIMACLFSVCFYIAGIKYAFVIGVFSGALNIIPYVGAVSALILSSLVALVSGTPVKALYAAVVVLVIQQIDTAIISPKVVGSKVKLHPVIVILSLSVFGNLFGVWSMVFAVPAAAVIKLNFDRLYILRRNKVALSLTQKKNHI